MNDWRSDHIDAVVLAGGINRIELYSGYTPGYKAVLPFAGRPSIVYPLEALRAVEGVRRICIVGPEEKIRPCLPAGWDCDFVPEGRTVAGSLVNGLVRFEDSAAVLIVTADLPLVTSEAVEAFLAGCGRIDPGYPEFAYLSVVPEEEFTGPYEGFSKGFARFRGSAVSHGNLALVTPSLVRHVRVTEGLDSLYRARKNGVRTSLALGWRIALGYLIGAHLLRWLTLEQMADIVSRRFGVGFIPVPVPYPAIALDVDEPADYRLIRKILEGEGGTAPEKVPDVRAGR